MSHVLCYHAVSRRWPAALSVEPDLLGEQLELLRSRGYRGVTFAELARRRGAGKLVAVTFDDAYRSVFEFGRPVLDRIGFPGSVYAVTSMVGRQGPMRWAGIDKWLGGPHENELSPATWSQLGELSDAGWEIGSHTRSHPWLPSLPDEELAAELSSSRHEIEERLGISCTTIAYPYGGSDERVLAAASSAGYTAAGALPARLSPRDSMAWPRIGVYHADGMTRFRLKVSPTLRWLRSTPLWSLFRRSAGPARPRPHR